MSFAALMALSATQTQQAQALVQSTLVERQKREAAKRKAQEERDRKAAQEEKARRAAVFERERKEQEKKRKEEENRNRIEQERLRREEEMRSSLRYGPKGKTSDSAMKRIREEVVKRPLPNDEDEDEDGTGIKRPKGTDGLTREELRARKEKALERKMFAAAAAKRRAFGTGRSRRDARRLPGGAIDTLSAPKPLTAAAGGTTRERIAAVQPTLIKLNTVKRDMRTIDEIHTQIKATKAHLLEGEEARSFNDFFPDKKKKAPLVSSKASTPTPSSSAPSSAKPTLSTATTSRASSADPSTLAKSRTATPTTTRAPPLPSAGGSSSLKRPSRPSSPPPSSKKRAVGSSTSSKPTAVHVKSSAKSSKRRSPPSDDEESVFSEAYDDYSGEDYDDDDDGVVPGMIYQMMRKGRQDRVVNVHSDDDDDLDMEADARILEREEKISAREAKREDLEALAAEKRHEEEKRRKKLGKINGAK